MRRWRKSLKPALPKLAHSRCRRRGPNASTRLLAPERANGLLPPPVGDVGALAGRRDGGADVHLRHDRLAEGRDALSQHADGLQYRAGRALRPRRKRHDACLLAARPYDRLRRRHVAGVEDRRHASFSRTSGSRSAASRIMAEEGVTFSAGAATFLSDMCEAVAARRAEAAEAAQVPLRRRADPAGADRARLSRARPAGLLAVGNDGIAVEHADGAGARAGEILDDRRPRRSKASTSRLCGPTGRPRLSARPGALEGARRADVPRLLQAPGHGAVRRRGLVRHRRPRLYGRGGLHPHQRPHQGHHHPRRRERADRRDRGPAVQASGGARGGARRLSRLASRRARLRVSRRCVPGHKLDLKAVQAYMAEHKVAKQYWPERIEIVDDLPKTPAGKIQKFQLREQAKAFARRSRRRRAHERAACRDRVCVVTGAARGIGLAIAERFGQEGARLACVDVSARRLEPAVDELERKRIRDARLCRRCRRARRRGAPMFATHRERVRGAGRGAGQQCRLGAVPTARRYRPRDGAAHVCGRRKRPVLDHAGRGAADGAARRRRDHQLSSVSAFHPAKNSSPIPR